MRVSFRHQTELQRIHAVRFAPRQGTFRASGAAKPLRPSRVALVLTRIEVDRLSHQ